MNENCKKKENSSASGDKPEIRNCTEELLAELIRSLDMGKQSITNVLPKVKDTKLTDELTAQLDSYAKFCDEATAMLKSIGGEAKSESLMKKMSAKIGIEMNTLTDSSDAHIAQMVIEGTTMGITEIIRLVRDYENSNCSEEALSLARRIVSFEEKTVDSMKNYL